MPLIDTAFKLNPIKLQPIDKGGYIISYTGKAPDGARLLLGVKDLHTAVDVTHRPAGDLLCVADLPKFLACIGRQKMWGTTLTCSLYAVKGTSVLANSLPEPFPAPIRPYVGKLHPSLGTADGGARLPYILLSPTLHIPAIDGCYYYEYGGKFETDDRRRGFNCITYAGAVFGVPARSGAMSQYGTQLANFCGATPCGLENSTGGAIKHHFATNPHGTYLMWGSDHVVVVVNSKVHEFSHKKGGYVSTDLQQWHFGGNWWVRKTSKQF